MLEHKYTPEAKEPTYSLDCLAVVKSRHRKTPKVFKVELKYNGKVIAIVDQLSYTFSEAKKLARRGLSATVLKDKPVIK